MNSLLMSMLYTSLGILTFLVGVFQDLFLPMASGIGVFIFGIYWVYKSTKKQGELKGW